MTGAYSASTSTWRVFGRRGAGWLPGVLVTVALVAPAGAQIRWRSAGPAVTESGYRAALDEDQHCQGTQEFALGRHVVAQFSAPLGPELRRQVGEAGVTLLSYLGENAFFAAVDESRFDTARLGECRTLRGLQTIEPFMKLHPMLLRGEIPAWAVVDYVPATAGRRAETESVAVVGAYVVFHADVALEPGATDLCRRHGAEVCSVLQSVNGLVIRLPYDRISALAEEDAVQWIEPPLPPLDELNDGNRALVGADIVQGPPDCSCSSEWPRPWTPSGTATITPYCSTRSTRGILTWRMSMHIGWRWSCLTRATISPH